MLSSSPWSRALIDRGVLPPPSPLLPTFPTYFSFPTPHASFPLPRPPLIPLPPHASHSLNSSEPLDPSVYGSIRHGKTDKRNLVITVESGDDSINCDQALDLCFISTGNDPYGMLEQVRHRIVPLLHTPTCPLLPLTDALCSHTHAPLCPTQRLFYVGGESLRLILLGLWVGVQGH